MAKRITHVVGLLLVACWAATAGAQPTQFSLDLGYQWTSISGNNDVFRSQVNEGKGLALHSLSIVSFDNSQGGKLFDRVRIDAAGIGGEPQSSFRLEAGLARTYNLRFTYRHAEFFNSLPDFANPLLGSGVFPGEYTLNRNLDSANLDVELLPGSAVRPLFGYSWVRYAGSGRTTAQVGQNEFRLDSRLGETTQEIRGGVAFTVGDFEGSIVQGWRMVDSTQREWLAAGAGDGNNTRPVLGQPITLSGLSDRTDTHGTTPMTTGLVTGRFSDRFRVVGSFTRADFNSGSVDTEAAAGSLASFKLSRFYAGLYESSAARAESTDWQGEVRVEADPIDGFEVAAAYTKKHRDLDGLATIADLYSNTVNFSGADPKDVSTLIDAATAMKRDENTFEAKVSATDLGPLRLWAGWARSSQDVEVTPAAAEIVVPGGQSGRFDREVKRTSAGATLLVGGLKFGVDWKKDDADKAVVRTDYLSLERWRGRVNWTAGKFMQLVGTAERITADNPTTGINQTSTTKHWAGDAVFTPIEPLAIRVGYGVYRVDSRITIRTPQDFLLVPSIYGEDGTSKEAGITYKVGRFGLDAAYSRFSNTGDLPLTLDRTTAGLDFDLTSTVGASLRFDKRKYEENLLPIANYDAKIYGFFLRWHN
jgi:hypothetical protein